MLGNFKIYMSVAVVVATAINILRLLQEVPPLDPVHDPLDINYHRYMTNHSLMMSIFVLLNMLVWFIGYCNRTIKSCMICNMIIFAYMVFKALFLDLGKHQVLDNTALGVALLLSVYYLIHHQVKGLLNGSKN